MSNIEKKIEATRFLMAQEDWDLFITVFAESHYAGHQLYHHFQRSHWAYDPKRAARLGDTLPRTYSELDSALATLLKGVAKDNPVKYGNRPLVVPEEIRL